MNHSMSTTVTPSTWQRLPKTDGWRCCTRCYSRARWSRHDGILMRGVYCTRCAAVLGSSTALHLRTTRLGLYPVLAVVVAVVGVDVAYRVTAWPWLHDTLILLAVAAIADMVRYLAVSVGIDRAEADQLGPCEECCGRARHVTATGRVLPYCWRHTLRGGRQTKPLDQLVQVLIVAYGLVAAVSFVLAIAGYLTDIMLLREIAVGFAAGFIIASPLIYVTARFRAGVRNRAPKGRRPQS